MEVSFMKGLVCLVGESFRLGRQRSKARDEIDSYDPQRQASASAVEFMNAILERKGVETDVFISSYQTKWRSDLESWYGSRLIGSFYGESLVGLEALIERTREHIDFKFYDFVFVLRIDLFVKPMLGRIFDPKWDKVMYPQACWIGGHACKGCPRVSDTMVFVPRHLCEDKVFMQHGACAIMVHDRKCGPAGLMINTFHDSDSAKDYNPLYRIVGRPEHRRWRSYGYVSDGLHPVESGISLVFDDWSVLDLMPPGQAEEIGIRSSEDILSSDDLWEWRHSFSARPMHFGGVVRLSKNNLVLGSPLMRGLDVRWSENKGAISIFEKGSPPQFVLERQRRRHDVIYLGSSTSDKRCVVSLKRLVPARSA